MKAFIVKHGWKFLVGYLAISLVVGWIYNQKLIKAELTNIALKEKARILESQRVSIREKYLLLGEVSTLRIDALKKEFTEKDSASQLILVKKSEEIKALRFTAGTWEEKYNRLEPECLQLSAKVNLFGEEIGLLKLTVAELEARDVLRLANIIEVEGKLTECQKLLGISIANTDLLLGRSWFLKIFNRVKFGPAVMVSTDGVFRLGLAAVWAVN